MMANVTMARPFSRPSARYWLEMARSTGRPRPFTPIMEAMTTMASDIMIVWFTPAKILGSASGIWTPNSFCR